MGFNTTLLRLRTDNAKRMYSVNRLRIEALYGQNHSDGLSV